MKLFPLFLLSAAVLHGQDAEPRQMMAQGYYFREPTDRDWEIRVVGEIPSASGAQYLLHDAAGTLLARKLVPSGNYTDSEPFVIRFPKDGKTGDYKLRIIGKQTDLLGPRMPLSTLPFEVYGRTYFTAGHNDTAIFFGVPDGVSSVNLRAYKGNLQVYQGQQLLGDAQRDGKLDGADWSLTVAVEPGKFYRIQRQCFYFRAPDGVYLCFDPKRWFMPDPKLDRYEWWQLTES